MIIISTWVLLWSPFITNGQDFPNYPAVNEEIVYDSPDVVDDYYDGFELSEFNKLTLTGDGKEDEVMQMNIYLKIEPRSGWRDPSNLWENGIVPYKLSEGLSEKFKTLIEEAAEEFKRKTCIKFIPHTDEKQFLSIEPGKGCSAGVGKSTNNEENKLNLSTGCLVLGIILHELMHALGFIHEHNRSNRDEYIRIVESNIEEEKKIQFQKISSNYVDEFDYDYGSILHYGENVFAIDKNKQTIVPLKQGVVIGQRDGFSETDILRINHLYNCSTGSSSLNSRRTGGYLPQGFSGRGGGSVDGLVELLRPFLLFWKHTIIAEEDFKSMFNPKPKKHPTTTAAPTTASDTTAIPSTTDVATTGGIPDCSTSGNTPGETTGTTTVDGQTTVETKSVLTTILTTVKNKYYAADPTTTSGTTPGETTGTTVDGQTTIDTTTVGTTPGKNKYYGADPTTTSGTTPGETTDITTDGQTTDITTDGQTTDITTDGQTTGITTDGQTTIMTTSMGTTPLNPGKNKYYDAVPMKYYGAAPATLSATTSGGMESTTAAQATSTDNTVMNTEATSNPTTDSQTTSGLSEITTDVTATTLSQTTILPGMIPYYKYPPIPTQQKENRKVISIGQDNKLNVADLVFEPLQSIYHTVSYHKISIVHSAALRSALRDPSKLWVGGIIPYVFSESYTVKQKALLLKAMAEFKNKTCVRFIPRTDEASYAFIEPENRCASTVGFQVDKPNEVKLSADCYTLGTIIHELMHVLGFIHEQNRPDRDQFVIIIWDNIKPGFKRNFMKRTWLEVQDLGIGYDFQSVMHYEANEFAIDENRPTIVALQPGIKIGQRIGFSKKDLIKINKLYSCNGRETVSLETEEGLPIVENLKKYLSATILNLFRTLLRTIRTFRPS